MRFDAITIFPELFDNFLSTSLVGKAIESGRLEVAVHDLRSYCVDRHRAVDDEPYGGGGGMVMKAEPWLRAVRQVSEGRRPWRVLLSPQGQPLDEAKVRQLHGRGALVLLCGRYEGIDERVRPLVVDEEVSIGDYVLSGGELPAMVLIEAVSRQIPGVVGLADSVEQDSFRRGLLDYPHYTRPRVIEELSVPEVLLSGDHQRVAEWRRRQALLATLEKRPDLAAAPDWTDGERRELDEVRAELLRRATRGEPEGRGREASDLPPDDPEVV